MVIYLSFLSVEPMKDEPCFDLNFTMNPFCDPETGICTPSSLEDLYSVGQNKLTEKTETIYVGDPMCS
ncbi:MAG: hypothetical protein AAFY41_01120, partial [Bacteroidota bacterium]